MTDQQIIDDIELLRAHASLLTKIADRLSLRLSKAGVSTPAAAKKKGLSNEQKARFSARRTKKRLSYLTK